MKLFDKKSLILLISVVSINLLCIISVSYAYFTANIKGNDTAKEMTVHAGSMEITYTDSNEVNLNNALPGDSVTKQFKVENTGTLDTKYNIKIDVNVNDFKDKKDLIYTLTKNGSDELTDEILPYEDGYIVIQNEIKSKAIDTYSLKVTFKNDLVDIDQNDNANKKVDFKIVVDSNDEVTLYEYEEPLNNNFYNTMLASNDTLYDDFINLRYVGATPSNYIWFNCDNYAEPSAETCEKWRIIGLFKDIDVVEGESTTKQDLVKIIRVDSVGTLAWDNNSNNWTNASLKTNLESYYNGEILSNANGVKESNKNMIEYVTWNLGGPTIYNNVTAAQFYADERSEKTYQSSRPATWDGYIGLMYPSDYGYATTGSNSGTKRDACLNTILYNYSGGCKDKDWLLDTSVGQWTITPGSSSSGNMFNVLHTGNVTSASAFDTFAVRPTLYLKSNVQIIDGKGTNEEPYRINA